MSKLESAIIPYLQGDLRFQRGPAQSTPVGFRGGANLPVLRVYACPCGFSVLVFIEASHSRHPVGP